VVIEVPEKKVTIELTISEALVLLEWVSTLDSRGSMPADKSVEEVVLWKLESQLEGVLRAEPLGSDYLGLVAAARERVRKLAYGERTP
jgi:hypothetical protein